MGCKWLLQLSRSSNSTPSTMLVNKSTLIQVGSIRIDRCFWIDGVSIRQQMFWLAQHTLPKRTCSSCSQSGRITWTSIFNLASDESLAQKHNRPTQYPTTGGIDTRTRRTSTNNLCLTTTTNINKPKKRPKHENKIKNHKKTRENNIFEIISFPARRAVPL